MTESIPRRIIRFGNSSFVVSLPKDWISKHKLKKGDLIYFSENPDNELVLAPKNSQDIPVDNPITIETDDKTVLEIQRELTSAYINSFNEIIFTGKKVSEKKEIIGKIVSEKMGIEITEESSSQVTVKDILDFESLSFERSVKRMDNIIKSMFEELIIGLRGPVFKEWTFKEMSRADRDVNKMYFLILKIVRRCQSDTTSMRKLKVDSRTVSNASWLAFHSEYIGDELKRIAKFLTQEKIIESERKHLLDVILALEKEYIETLSSYHRNDKISAQRLANRKDINLNLCEKFFEKSASQIRGNMTEKLKGISSTIADIAKIVAY